ncbi:alpha/beta hydrolase fold [Devosia lucknowensis]|uniref:Alpha/beta hydrolase fold n=1 Tax=Devosia lucknowensis TaxID=1096929 RepID=A0A1Y6EL67_9HYPH|nr:alpha/beta fold hydrolase [Devosia lucknowensis]SMQ61302.1 alpha/beta hydrolase fold [Devosia lucknowensis]
MNKSTRLFHLGWVIILVGVLLAHFIQTSGGISIRDIRFNGTNGQVLSGLLYVPPGVSADNKAPGILAVHGYINSRETQSGFAIEYARRGYVVLALDQSGHGYSDAPAFANGFGGPAGLSYLRSLDIVDVDNIGLEGHSMGGWTVLAAAATMPDAYKAVVLEGSSTGAPFAQEGSTEWPRNLAVVFSKYDEFSQLMWGVDRAQDVAQSTKLQAVFGTNEAVVPGQVYGDIAAGTARLLQTPNTTHPGDHISPEAIGYSIDWLAQTLEGAQAIPAGDQIWLWKEIGTLIALAGFVVLLAGTFEMLLGTQAFANLRKQPVTGAHAARNGKWWLVFALSAFVPVLTYFLFLGWGAQLLPGSALLPQTITSQIAFWAVLNGMIVFGLGFVLKGEKLDARGNVLGSVLIALATVGIGYLFVLAADFLFKVDFRFWVVALKPMSLVQAKIALVYLVPFTLFFVLALRGLHKGLSVTGDSRAKQYLSNIGALALGFLVFLAIQYGNLLFAGHLFMFSDPLMTVVAIQFLPLMAIIAFLSTFTYRRTGSYLPGAFINALFVTWYIVAGQATQFPVS